MKAATATAALLALSRALHEATTLAEAMDRVVASIEEHTRYRRAWLILPSDDRGIEVVGYALPDRARVDQRMSEIDFATDPWLKLHLEATDPLIRDDLREEPLADQRQVAYFGNRTLISVPMLRVGGRVGALCVGTFAAEGVLPPTPEEVEFIIQVGALVSVVAGRIRAEQRQRVLEERVSGAQRLEALGRMAGEISHDFNNMLVSILGNAEVASTLLGEDHPARELIDEVGQAAERAARLTRQLLSFSRGQPLERRDVRLAAVVDGLLPMLRSLLPADVSLEVTHGPGASVVFADAGQLEQVLLNLVVNARDAMPRGGRIVLSTASAQGTPAGFSQANRPAPSNEYVVLSVADTGTGMTPEVRERLFEPFFTTKAPGVGTGLGLAVVDTVLKRHDGFITVDSELGRGTTFRIHFPASAAVPAESIAPRFESAVSPKGHERILVVDDDRQVRALLERVLCQAEYRVLLAEDGAAALETLEREPGVALVLSDLVMPHVGGDELRDILATRVGAPPVLIMSGYARGAAVHERYEHLLAKPFSPAQLLRKVRAVLDGQRGSRAPAA